MNDLRSLGPRGLATYLKQHGASASLDLDRICAQKDAHTSLLYWFTDLDAAKAEARATRRPILSLRLLGRLDEERTCANSRFFRKLLYPDAKVRSILGERFVLHWQSVRPVPILTLDFGDRRIEKTITGNSLHAVLDAEGRPVDALPGLFDPATFAGLLLEAHRTAMTPRAELAKRHESLVRALPPAPARPPSRAERASMLAMSKHMVESPLLAQLRRVGENLAADTAQNLAIHRRIHEAFAAGMEWSADAMVDWIYEELFLMPLHDPALGLDQPDPVFMP